MAEKITKAKQDIKAKQDNKQDKNEKKEADETVYDVIIIGGGAAGLSAALYCARFVLKVLIITKEMGGTGKEAHIVDNWIGTPGITGYNLMKNFEDHVKKYNVPIINNAAMEIKKTSVGFSVKTEKKEFQAKTVIFATGMAHKKLDVPGEKQFEGRGVSYCTHCDANLFKDKVVAVVGGNDSAAQGALLLSKYASKVYIIYRREKLRAEPVTAEQVYSNKKIEVVYNAEIKEIFGEKIVKGILLSNGKKLEVSGVFVHIGSEPQTELAEKIGVKIDGLGFIEVTKEQETNVKGFYSAGDSTDGKLKQLITAAADGSRAAHSAYLFIKDSKDSIKK